MTVEMVDVQPREAVGASRTAGPLLALGRREARRIVLSPVYAVGFGLVFVTTGIGSFTEGALPTAEHVYEFIGLMLVMMGGLLTYLAAHLVTSSARRTNADRQLESSTMSSRSRGGALCLGVVFGPSAVAAGLLVVLAIIGSNAAFPDGSQRLAVVELVQIALLIVGGGVFGVMTATWLRFPGSLLLGFLVLGLGTPQMYQPTVGPVDTLPWFAPFVTGPGFAEDSWVNLGSQSWHTAYLVGLCCLAVCAVMLHRRVGRGRWLLVSAGVFAATAFFGWMQV
ncbi:MAG: hypothetical protein OEV62_00995 [Actinomycetota bacterium]|nr:hypothetical protein [Actinomycetota bacterium]MDH4352493.1 hypothetical protein [Actinomycetota bacterium]MDH5277473.1 hypothetical protein [Actinomycetota bacterium]